MGYFVDRVVICDAYAEPSKHYRVLPGGKSMLKEGRRPSMRFLASAKDAKSGMAGIVGKEQSLFEDLAADYEQQNEFVNTLRGEVRAWRDGLPSRLQVEPHFEVVHVAADGQRSDCAVMQQTLVPVPKTY